MESRGIDAPVFGCTITGTSVQRILVLIGQSSAPRRSTKRRAVTPTELSKNTLVNHLRRHLAPSSHGAIERCFFILGYVAAKVLGFVCLSNLEVLAARGFSRRRFFGRLRSRRRGGRWSGFLGRLWSRRRGGRGGGFLGRLRSGCRGRSGTEVLADGNTPQKGQVGNVSLVIGITSVYDDAATGGFVAHVEHNFKVGGGGLEVIRRKRNRLLRDGSGRRRVNRNVELDRDGSPC